MNKQSTTNFKGIVFILGLLFSGALVFTCRPSPEEIKMYMDMLGDPQDEATVKAQKRLGQMGAITVPSIAELCKAVEEPVLWDNSLKRVSACQVLGKYLGDDPQAMALLLELTATEDGMLKGSAIHYLRNAWGKRVYEQLSEKIVNALADIIKQGDRELAVYRHDSSEGSTEQSGAGRAYFFDDFDSTAVETVAVMYSVQKDLEPQWGLLCKKALESALDFPRVKAMAKKALEGK
jgi:hypothetical protein